MPKEYDNDKGYDVARQDRIGMHSSLISVSDLEARLQRTRATLDTKGREDLNVGVDG